MSEEQYRMALEEVYRLALRSDGKRERKTKQICRSMLGEAACRRLEAEDEARRASATKHPPGYDGVHGHGDPTGVPLAWR